MMKGEIDGCRTAPRPFRPKKSHVRWNSRPGGICREGAERERLPAEGERRAVMGNFPPRPSRRGSLPGTSPLAKDAIPAVQKRSRRTHASEAWLTCEKGCPWMLPQDTSGSPRHNRNARPAKIEASPFCQPLSARRFFRLTGGEFYRDYGFILAYIKIKIKAFARFCPVFSGYR